MNRIDFDITLNFNHSNMRVNINNSEVKFISMDGESPIRPRHLAVASQIMSIILEAEKVESPAKVSKE